MRYEAITPEAFHGLLASIDLGDHDLTFIDLGSGKGRAVLLASLYPFRRLIGVEFSPELTEVARLNVQAVSSCRAALPGHRTPLRGRDGV